MQVVLFGPFVGGKAEAKDIVGRAKRGIVCKLITSDIQDIVEL